MISMLNSNYINCKGGAFDEVGYYHWLLDKVGATNTPYINYLLLLQTLHKRDYIWVVPGDANRVQDAYSLRSEFCLLNGVWPPVDENGDIPAASVLEVLTALSYRCENDIMGEPGIEHPARWFWIIIKNLNLMQCTDDHFDTSYVNQQLDIWLEHRYKRNGQGGPFPLRKPDGDQRKKELWQQMSEFLNENYCSTI